MSLRGKYLELYQQSSFSEAVLVWYSFSATARVLDLSKGALTELLRNRCASVDISAEDAGSYDYLALLDPENFSIETLSSYAKLLKRNGRLLLAYENPFALRYWAGHAAPYTGKPYDTLQKRGDNPAPSKQELTALLRAAGFKGLKWYYPLADHWLTSEIYSETYLPNEFLGHRLVNYIDDDPHRQFDEQPLYRDVIANGAFEFMCGAYLVEARLDEAETACAIDYAAVTSYRTPGKRFATLLKNDGTAWKIPLHDDAYSAVERIYENHRELQRLGVNALECSIDSGCLKMQRLDLPTLFDYWAQQFSRNTFCIADVIAIYDRIRNDIHKAAQTGTCYWELVPANCFYNVATDELTYFDQEYCAKGIDPDVAFTRAVLGLKYSFAFAKDPRIQQLCEELLSKYQLRERGMLSEYGKLDTYSEVFGESHRLLKQYTEDAVLQLSLRTQSKEQAVTDSE